MQSYPPAPQPDPRPNTGFPGPPPPIPVPPPKRRRTRQLIVLGVFLVLVAAFFAVAFLATRHQAAYAKVGDCVSQTGENSIKIVKCDDPSAAYRVVGRVENRSEVDASLDACAPYVSQGAQQVYWQGTSGGTGLVLCLAKNHG